jgi:CRISPR type III-A/MTUBE-associated protein Csm6
MLHICRHYKPDKVILYLSDKIWEYENSDRRYTRAIDLLKQQLGDWIPTVSIVRSQVSKVFRYDAFITDFRQNLTGLGTDTDELLLNVSSGTPQMQQALVAMYAFGLPNATALQVTTPRADANRSTDREDPNTYDLDLLWEANDDRDVPRNRCLTVSTPHFGDLVLVENAKALVKGYDYEAAAEVLGQLVAPDSRTQAATDLVTGCQYRMRLDHQHAVSYFGGTQFAYDASKDQLGEYVATLEVRAKQHRYADFVRAVTPAISQALNFHLSVAGWPKHRYLDANGKIDRVAVDREPVLDTVFGYRKGFPYNRDYYALLETVEPTHRALAGLRRLISFEGGLYESDCRPGEVPLDGVRNRAAHQIVPITEAQMKDWGGMNASETMTALRSVTGATGARTRQYDDINAEILRLLAS